VIKYILSSRFDEYVKSDTQIHGAVFGPDSEQIVGSKEV